MKKNEEKKEEVEPQGQTLAKRPVAREHEQRKKALEKLAEKGCAHCKLELGAVRLYIRVW